MKNKRKKQIAFVSIGILVLVCASVYTVMIRPRMNEVKVIYEPITVQRGCVRVSVNESGAIEYEQSQIMYDLNLDVSDEEDEEETSVKYLVVDEVYKAAGEIVQEGEAILRFSESSIESVRKILASAVADAQVEYNDAKSEYELSCLKAEVDYKTQQIDSKYAKDIYGDASAKITDNISAIQAEIDYRQGNMESLKEAVTDAEKDYEDALATYNELKGIMNSINAETYSHTGYLDYQKRYLNAQTNYYNALSVMERVQDSLKENEAEISKLQNQLSEAKASKSTDAVLAKQQYEEEVQRGENAYFVYQASLESLEEELKESKEKLESREEQQEAFEAFVGVDGIVRAPKEGMLVSVDVEVGDKLTKELTLVSYVCDDGLTISVDVTEEDVVSLSIGQPVDIVLTAYPDETFEGTIASIDTTATASNTNTVSYTVVIGLPGILNRMYGGMTAKVSFETDSSDNTLFISRKALVEENDSYYVYVKNAFGEYERKKVTIGLKNTLYAEITSGLDENETIYIRTTGV